MLFQRNAYWRRTLCEVNILRIKFSVTKSNLITKTKHSTQEKNSIKKLT